MSGTISNEVDGDELCRLIISHLCVPETRFGIASSQGSSSFLEKTADGNDERKTRWRKEGATIQEIVRTTPNPYHSGSSTTKPPCKSNAESIWYRYWWSNKKIIRLESLDQPIEQPAALHDIIDLYWHAAEGFCQCICDEIWKKLPQNPQGRSVWTRDLNGMSCSEEQIKHYLYETIGLFVRIMLKLPETENPGYVALGYRNYPTSYGVHVSLANKDGTFSSSIAQIIPGDLDWDPGLEDNQPLEERLYVITDESEFAL